ncbi:MAG: hypothetical protein AB7F64_00900 [Gammaproteobacteria bacterium]
MQQSIENQLLHIVRVFLKELGAGRAERGVYIQANLEQDLGIGSLERAEYFTVLKKPFQFSYPPASWLKQKHYKTY